MASKRARYKGRTKLSQSRQNSGRRGIRFTAYGGEGARVDNWIIEETTDPAFTNAWILEDDFNVWLTE